MKKEAAEAAEAARASRWEKEADARRKKEAKESDKRRKEMEHNLRDLEKKVKDLEKKEKRLKDTNENVQRTISNRKAEVQQLEAKQETIRIDSQISSKKRQEDKAVIETFLSELSSAQNRTDGPPLSPKRLGTSIEDILSVAVRAAQEPTANKGMPLPFEPGDVSGALERLLLGSAGREASEQK